MHVQNIPLLVRAPQMPDHGYHLCEGQQPSPQTSPCTQRWHIRVDAGDISACSLQFICEDGALYGHAARTRRKRPQNRNADVRELVSH